MANETKEKQTTTNKPKLTGRGGPGRGGGRKKGEPNKITVKLKEVILAAAEAAGGKEGALGYLTEQARAEPRAFLALLGKVLPLTIDGSGEDGVITVVMVSKQDKL